MKQMKVYHGRFFVILNLRAGMEGHIRRLDKPRDRRMNNRSLLARRFVHDLDGEAPMTASSADSIDGASDRRERAWRCVVDRIRPIIALILSLVFYNTGILIGSGEQSWRKWRLSRWVCLLGRVASSIAVGLLGLCGGLFPKDHVQSVHFK